MIEVDAKQLERAQLLLRTIPNGANRAVAAALNRAAEGGRADAVKAARENYYVKVSYVRREIKIIKATFSNPVAIIKATGRTLPLIRFNVTPHKPSAKKRGVPVRAQVRKDSQGGVIPHAFVVRVKHDYQKTGHIGVFTRAGESRFPIKEKYGPSVPQMLGNKVVFRYVEEKAYERLEERLDHEINRLLRGVGK